MLPAIVPAGSPLADAVSALGTAAAAMASMTSSPTSRSKDFSCALSRSQALPVLRQVRSELLASGFDASVQLFSTPKREGVEEVETVVRGWLGVAKKDPAQGEGAGQNLP